MAILSLLFLIIIYFFPVIFGRQVFYYGDIVSIFLPLRQWFFSWLHQGVLPLWNPDIYSGYPFIADMTLSNFYPPAWILFFNSSIKAVSWLMIGHFFIAGYFMYRLGRWLKLPEPAALFSALIYTFSGIMVNYIADPQRFFVISLMPLFFYALFKGGVIFLALALSLQIFAGHIQYVFIELLVSLFFWRRLKVLLPAGILAGLLTAVSLLPMLEFIPFTTRPEAYLDLSIYQNFSLNPVSLVRFILAHFWGIKNQGSAWGTLDTSTIGYLGFLPLLVILLTIKPLLKNRTAMKFLLISGLSLVISFGTYLPFFKILTTYIPIFRLFRNPMAFLSLYSFSMALLAGYGFQIFRFEKKSVWLRWIFLLLFLASAAVWLAVKLNGDLPHQLLLWLAEFSRKTLSGFHTVAVDRLIAGFILENLVLVGFIAGTVFFVRSKTAIIVATVIDLFIFTRSNYYAIRADYFADSSPVIAFLNENLGSGRFLSSSEAVPYSGLNDFYGTLNLQTPFARDSKRLSESEIGNKLASELKLIPPNFSAKYRLPTVNGYTSFVIKKYNRLFQVNDKINPLYEQVVAFNPLISQRGKDLALSKIDLAMIDLNDQIFNELGVKFWITDRDLGLPENQLVFRDGDVAVFRNNQALPRAVLLSDQGEIIEAPPLNQPSPNQLSLKLKNTGKLVIYDTDYPGWQAAVNGRPVPVEPYQDVFRSVTVNETDAEVVFTFRPRSFYLGAWISLISFVLVLIYAKVHHQ